MGGGRKPKSANDVVLQTPRPKHQSATQFGGSGVGGTVEDIGAANRCKTFVLDNPKVTMRKLWIGTQVYTEMNGHGIEVKAKVFGTIGSVPSRIAATMRREGRDLQWSGQVVEMDKDRLSIKVTLCPT